MRLIDLNKVKWLTLLLGCIAILVVPSIRIYEVGINYEANISKAEECMEKGASVVLEKKGYFALSSVQCE